mmetsp:Transcript_37262/g.86626  ORF Transcript_37262/g.86626 Transcript_37262/m.86626 type:complete len:91 (-) Transcript_37262:52-324(-)
MSLTLGRPKPAYRRGAVAQITFVHSRRLNYVWAAMGYDPVVRLECSDQHGAVVQETEMELEAELVFREAGSAENIQVCANDIVSVALSPS